MQSDKQELQHPLLAYVIAVLVIGVIVWAAWNVGVVGIVAACGGHVSTITYWTALFGWIAAGIVAALLGRALKR